MGSSERAGAPPGRTDLPGCQSSAVPEEMANPRNVARTGCGVKIRPAPVERLVRE